MKRSKTTGWQQVYQFTFTQLWKSKTVRIMSIILCTVALISMPVLQLVSTLTSEDTQSHINKVVVVDESDLSKADYTVITKSNEQYQNIEFTYSDKSVDDVTKELMTANDNTILLHITSNQGIYNLDFMKSPSSAITDSELSIFSNLILECFNMNRIQSLGISEEQTELINAPITTEVYTIGATATGNENNDNQQTEETKVPMSMNQYYVALAITTIAIMFLAFAGESIASSIITEKSTRVIEYLMTSIRPLAVIIGKVLAVLSVNIMQLILIIVSFIGSCFIKQSLYPSEGLLPGILKNVVSSEVFTNVTPVTVILSIVIFFSGFLLFALIAGLAGATVSRVEELAEGIMVYNACMIIGAYLSIAVCIAEMSGSTNGILTYVAYALPISSFFVTPVFMLFGIANPMFGVVSLLILIASIVGLAIFTAKVYETLILHQGNRLKIKDLITISKQSKGETLKC